MTTFLIPLRLPSLANLRWGWRKLATMKRHQKVTTRLAMLAGLYTNPLPKLPLLVTITRLGPAKLDDDNLSSACKYVRDAIADVVGVDDGSSLYTWRYEQRRGKYGVEVEITRR